MTFFMKHTMAYFNSAFVSKQGTGLKKCKQVTEHKFLVELSGSSQYTELQIFEGFLEWFKCKISNSTTNLLQWFDIHYPQKDKVHWTTKVASLWGKNSWWAKFSNNWLKKKVKLAPWMEEGTQKFLTQIGSSDVLWIPSTTNVLPLLGGNNQGGYCVLHKV
jgi:hypothetical protein